MVTGLIFEQSHGLAIHEEKGAYDTSATVVYNVSTLNTLTPTAAIWVQL